MAVIGPPQEQPQTGTKGSSGVRSARREFDAFTDNDLDTVATVLDSPYVVQEGNGFPGDASMICKLVSATQNRAKKSQWRIVADYERPQPGDGGGGPGSGTGNPEDEVPEYSVSSQQYTKFFDKDIDGLPIKNSANEPFVPPVEGNVSIGVYRISRNRFFFNDAQAKDYRDTVNSDDFTVSATSTTWVFPEGTAYLQSYDGTRQYRAGMTESGYYWRITWVILYNPDGWRKLILDQGTMEIDDSDPDAPGGSMAPNKPLKGPDGLPLNGPVLLDGAGKPLQPGQDPVFLPLGGDGFKIYREQPFAVLELSIT